MINDPLVTVNILSFNRKNELRLTLKKVLEQSYKQIEIIVVDNASVDGTPEMVMKEFPSVKIIKLEKNFGIAGWNEGFKKSNGEYVLVLDDDSYPDNTTIMEGISALENNKFEIVAFNIINLRTGQSETADFKNINPYQFTGCGALIKKNVFERIGYYDNNFFIYFNEIDFCIRAYDAGLRIIYLDHAKVYHIQTTTSRVNNNQHPYLSRYRYYHNFLGWHIFLIKNFDLKYSLKYLCKWIVNRFIVCLKYPYFNTFLKALFVVIIRTPKIIIHRKVVKLEIQQYYNYGNMPFIDRWFYKDFDKKKFISKWIV